MSDAGTQGNQDGWFNMGNPADGLGGAGGDSLLSDAAPSPQDRALAALGIQQVQVPTMDGGMQTYTIDPAILNYDFTQHNGAMNFANGLGSGSNGSFENSQIPAGNASPANQDFHPAGKAMSVDSVSLTGGFGFGPFFGWSPTLQGSVGLAIDDQGRVALIGSGGGSLTGGHGAGAVGGLNLSTSNAGSVANLKGGFNEQSVGGGDGLAAYGTAFQGKDPAGNGIHGYGLTLGFGGGASYSSGKTDTVVVPLAGYGDPKY